MIFDKAYPKIALVGSEGWKEIVNLEADVFGQTSWGEKSLRETISNSHNRAALYYTQKEAPPVGFLIWQFVAGEAEILLIGVLPSARRQGIARALFGFFLERLSLMGGEKVFLDVSHRNQVAIEFYKQLGFVVIGHRLRYYSDGSDGILMQFLIDP